MVQRGQSFFLADEKRAHFDVHAATSAAGYTPLEENLYKGPEAHIEMALTVLRIAKKSTNIVRNAPGWWFHLLFTSSNPNMYR